MLGTLRTRRNLRLAKHAVLLFWAAVCMFPLALILSASLSKPTLLFTNPYELFESFSTSNFSIAWSTDGFSRDLVNSMLLSVPVTAIVVAVSLGAGYAFGRCEFVGKRVAFYGVSLGLVFPFFAIMVPAYYEIQHLGLLNSRLGAVLIIATTNVSFGVFLMRSFFIGLPKELELAARIDGCNEWQLFRSVMVPLVWPGTLTVAAFTFLQSWNNFLVPLLFLTGQGSQTLSLGLYQFVGTYSIAVGPLAAGAVITIVPVLLVFAITQRRLVLGFLGGAFK